MEFNKEQLEQAWQDRFEREHEYLTLIEGYRNAKQKALDKAEPDSVEYWQLSIEIFDLDTNIKTKEHYIESMKQDKAQQQAFQDAKMQFIETHATGILKKARVCIDRGTDRATVLEALTKEMPQRETPEWYARIWEINEHVNAAKVPTTEQPKAFK
jgi:cell division protein YceG involved in septum cleavage